MGKSITENFKEFTNATQEYVEASISYHKLDLFKKIMKGVVSSTHKIILGFFFLIALIFMSFALAIYLGRILEAPSLGYLIVGIGYFVIMILLSFFLKGFLTKNLLTRASTQFFNDSKESKTEEYESLQ